MSIDIDALIDRECPTPMLYDKWRRWLVARIGDEIDQINTDRDTLTRENADLRARLASGDKCHPFVCNPTCPLCGDTPSCGDGSWRWNGKRHEHRCRDAHPQSGHDEVLCEKHQPGALIAMLRDEVKALRNARDAKIAELDRAEKARDEQAEAVRAVLAERARQDAKWGVQNHSPEVWLTILGEEYGEACQAALSDRFGGNAEKLCGQLRAELVQVAAVAIAMIEWMDRKAAAAAVKEASNASE